MTCICYCSLKEFPAQAVRCVLNGVAQNPKEKSKECPGKVYRHLENLIGKTATVFIKDVFPGSVGRIHSQKELFVSVVL